MLTFQKTDALLYMTTDADNPTWCAFEITHQPPNEAPSIIFVAACKLSEVFSLRQALNNSEFRRIVTPGTPIGIRIFATGLDRHAVYRDAQNRMEAFPTRPICNLRGFKISTPGRSRNIKCSNGKTYRNQTEAAADLGVHQPTISRHMSGMSKNVRGETLWYDKG